MEEEVREILSSQLRAPKKSRDLYAEIRAIVEPIGGIELELPPRSPGREPPDFSNWELKGDDEE